jgi:putative transposase
MDMPRWKSDYDPSRLYFVTTTAIHRVHLFKRDVIRRLIVDVLDMIRILRSLELYAFVVMPNHVHFIVQCTTEYTISDLMREFKPSVTNRIVWQYQAERNQEALRFLREAVQRPDKQRYQVWDKDYDAKDAFSADFLRQKMEYTHNNPIQPHWQLVDRAEDYVWSSARFYLLGEPALIPLSDATRLLV